MPRKALFQACLVLFLLVAVFLFVAAHPALAGTETTLHSFAAQGHGAAPQGGLISDAAGNLYGVSATGGAYNYGTVFELIPNRHGGWDQEILYTFKGGNDGIFPEGQLVFDAAGNLYGSTYWGGNVGGCLYSSNGAYVFESLYSFTGVPPDGGSPQGGLILGPSGSLLGTTENGGNANQGAVFAVTP